MRFHPAWWRWLFYERIGKLILGVFGSIPLYLGFALKKNKLQTHLILLLLGILIYFSVIARGNIQHDYYQILIIPFISIFVGIGSYYMFKFINPFSGIIVLLFSLSFSVILKYFILYQCSQCNSFSRGLIINFFLAFFTNDSAETIDLFNSDGDQVHVQRPTAQGFFLEAAAPTLYPSPVSYTHLTLPTIYSV